MAHEIGTIAVVGSGVIGASWSLLFLSHGLRVIMSDPAEGAEAKFRQYMNEWWQSNRPQDKKHNWAQRFEFVDDMTPRLPDVDFIQENGPESLEFKQRLIQNLDAHARPGVVIASSSSGLLPSEFVKLCEKDAGRVLVGHPFNPPHLIPLVEIVPHPGTSQYAVSAAQDFYKSLGKRPILLRREVPGFVVNRLQAAINNEAYSLISRGIVSAADLDAAVSAGPGLRWALTGPIAINALGGGGGPNGFAQRLERLGPSIRNWEDDIVRNRFDWSEEKLAKLNDEVAAFLGSTDLDKVVTEREPILVELLAMKSRANSLV